MISTGKYKVRLDFTVGLVNSRALSDLDKPDGTRKRFIAQCGQESEGLEFGRGQFDV